jgi:SpoVK/Ycf46/Vps4 family AAA+-type ATPase
MAKELSAFDPRLNFEFVDLLVSRFELVVESMYFQRYGVPENLAEGQDAATVLEGRRRQVQQVDRRLLAIRNESRSAGQLLPFDRLIANFGLTPAEADTLAFAVAPMFDPNVRDWIARFRDNILLNYVDVDLCLRVQHTSRPARLQGLDMFGERAALARHRLIKVRPHKEARADQVLAYEVQVPGRVVSYLLGQAEVDPSLAPYARLLQPAVPLEHVVLPEEILREVLNLADQFNGRMSADARTLATAMGPVPRGAALEFCGPSGTGKTHFARAIASWLGCPILEVDCGRLGSEDHRFKALIEDVFWQARISSAVLVLDRAEVILGEASARLPTLFAELDDFVGLAILITADKTKIDPSVERWVIYQFEFEPPDMMERARLWTIHLPSQPKCAPDVEVEFLASQFELTGGQIRNAALVATNMALAEPVPGDERKITTAHLHRAAHAQMRASLSQYARKSRIKLTLEDLILPVQEKREIQTIIDAAKSRAYVMSKWGFGTKLSTGKGIVVLFSGDPGTGKTLCAEIMAKELALELYQISIPQVMSKYIGETEKNIQKIFDSAKANHAMLLFDEADSLFTSRVKVESSVDKFSNMETNLLLQEIERFDGVCILTTNLDKSIDRAFQRRIQFKVHFPFPEPDARASIWRLLFPRSCPIAPDLDWDIVGKSFEISGGHIKNAVLRSAYRAAITSGVVDMATIRFAAEQECKQAGKLFRSFLLPGEPGYED